MLEQRREGEGEADSRQEEERDEEAEPRCNFQFSIFFNFLQLICKPGIGALPQTNLNSSFSGRGRSGARKGK